MQLDTQTPAPVTQAEQHRRRTNPRSESARQRRALAQNRGILGPKFESFVQVKRMEFASRGVSAVVPNRAAGTLIDCISKLEFDCTTHMRTLGAEAVYTQVLMHAEEDDPVFEGCPGTLTIAAGLGFKHPALSSAEYRLMTLDVVAQDPLGRLYGAFVRYRKDVPVAGSRQAELLQIVRAYWVARGVRIRVYTENDFPQTWRAASAWSINGHNAAAECSQEFLAFLRRCDPSEPLNELLTQWGADAMDAFKKAIAIGHVRVESQTNRVPLVTQPWTFRVIGKRERDTNIGAFFREAQDE